MIPLRSWVLSVVFLFFSLLVNPIHPATAQEGTGVSPEEPVSEGSAPLQEESSTQETSTESSGFLSNQPPPQEGPASSEEKKSEPSGFLSSQTPGDKGPPMEEPTGEEVKQEQSGVLSFPASSDSATPQEGFTVEEEGSLEMDPVAVSVSEQVSSENDDKPTTYVVLLGDSLWSISASQLADPFLWPKLWGANRDIFNPDLIYPGLVLNLPSELELSAGMTEAKPEEVPELEPEVEVETVVEPTADMEEEFIEVVEVEEMVENPEETQVQDVSPRTKINPTLVLTSGYILPNQEATGVVVDILGEKTLFSEGDILYVKPGEGYQPEVGDRLVVFKRAKKVRHPKTGAKLGQLILIQGMLDVLSVQEKVVTTKVVKSFDVIYKGDEVAFFDFGSLHVSMAEGPPPSLQGYIVEVKEKKNLNGQHDVVYLDMGRKHGVSAGDRFNITRPGKKTSLFSPAKGVRLPGYVIGQLEVIGTQELTATAKILNTTEAVVRGDRVLTP